MTFESDRPIRIHPQETMQAFYVRDFSCHSKVSARQRHASKGNATSWQLFLAHGWLMTGRFHFFSVCSALTPGPQAAALRVPCIGSPLLPGILCQMHATFFCCGSRSVGTGEKALGGPWTNSQQPAVFFFSHNKLTSTTLHQLSGTFSLTINQHQPSAKRTERCVGLGQAVR